MQTKKPVLAVITADTRVEDIVQKYPLAVGWLVQHGIVCMACGEPFWGTILELIEKKGIKNPDKLVRDLNKYLEEG
jgi:hypothetical protein